MKIIEDIYLVGSGMVGISETYDCHVYLVDCGNELVLVDSGAGRDIKPILNNIRNLGFDPSNISLLLITHVHADHAGGCYDIKKAAGCKVALSKIEVEIMEKGSEIELGLDRAKTSGCYPNEYRFKHCKVDNAIEDGEIIKVGKYNFIAIHTPGHSKGSMCYYLKQKIVEFFFPEIL